MLKLITNDRGETLDPAEEQARLDLEQDAPNDRAVQVFREEMARHGDPQLATVKAMDAWLFGAKAVRT